MENDLTRSVATLNRLRKIDEFFDSENNKIVVVGRKRDGTLADYVHFIAFKANDIVNLTATERVSVLAEARFLDNRFRLFPNSALGVKKEHLSKFSEIVTQNF